MDDGSDLAIISGSGKLPLLIKKLYKEALFFDINGESISRLKSLELWFKDLDFFLEKANKRNILVIYVLPVPEFIESAQACLFSANRKKCSQIDKKFLCAQISSSLLS